MSSSHSCAPAGTLAALPEERSSMTVTSWPAASSASARCEPMKPAPPVTIERDGISGRLSASEHVAIHRGHHPACDRARALCGVEVDLPALAQLLDVAHRRRDHLVLECGRVDPVLDRLGDRLLGKLRVAEAHRVGVDLQSAAAISERGSERSRVRASAPELSSTSMNFARAPGRNGGRPARASSRPPSRRRRPRGRRGGR